MGQQQREEERGEDPQVWPPALGIETAVPRLRGATAQHHHRCPCGDGHYDARDLGSRSREVLRKMQKAVLSGTLIIARTFKVAT